MERGSVEFLNFFEGSKAHDTLGNRTLGGLNSLQSAASSGVNHRHIKANC